MQSKSWPRPFLCFWPNNKRFQSRDFFRALLSKKFLVAVAQKKGGSFFSLLSGHFSKNYYILFVKTPMFTIIIWKETIFIEIWIVNLSRSICLAAICLLKSKIKCNDPRNNQIHFFLNYFSWTNNSNPTLFIMF